MLLEGYQPPRAVTLSHRQIRDDLMSVILAGHETTASELAWAFQLLAHDPPSTARLVDSLDNGRGPLPHGHRCKRCFATDPFSCSRSPGSCTPPSRSPGTPSVRPYTSWAASISCSTTPSCMGTPTVPARALPDRLSRHPRSGCPGAEAASAAPDTTSPMLEMQLVLRTVLSELRVLPVGDRVETARWRSVIVTPGRGSRILLRRRSDADSPCRRASRVSLDCIFDN